MISLIDDGDLDRGTLELLGRSEAAESCADDHNSM
jgi:hypothetical protein